MKNDTSVLPFRQSETMADLLTELAREGARRMPPPPKETRLKVIAKTVQETPPNATHWSRTLMPKPPPLQAPLYAHQCFMAEPFGAFLCRDHIKAYPTRQLRQRR